MLLQQIEVDLFVAGIVVWRCWLLFRKCEILFVYLYLNLYLLFRIFGIRGELGPLIETGNLEFDFDYRQSINNSISRVFNAELVTELISINF